MSHVDAVKCGEGFWVMIRLWGRRVDTPLRDRLGFRVATDVAAVKRLCEPSVEKGWMLGDR